MSKVKQCDNTTHKFEIQVIDVVMEIPVDRRWSGKISLGRTGEEVRS